MTDPLERLQKLNRQRLELHTAYQRAKLGKFVAPALTHRIQNGLDRSFKRLTRERDQLLELIKADPVMRKRLFDYEESLRKPADAKKDKDR